MPQIDPTQYLMDALAVMTGGLVNDMKTLILGLVVCSFILMALDILKDLVLIPVATSLLNPAETYQAAKEMYHRHRLSGLQSGPKQSAGDGVELSGDRYQELEDAMEEADRRQHRMSDKEASAMISRASDDYRRRNR